MNARPSYQVMPPLSPAEYAALKADIAERGVQVPVEYDEEGHILDGFHCVQICEELGIDYPKVVRSGLTDEHKRAHAWALNLTRRHLSKAQKRVIAGTLRQEGWTQERIAQVLGLSQATILGWLHEFISSDKLPQPATIDGKDGKRYPSRKTRQPSPQRIDAADTERETEQVPPSSASTSTTSAPEMSPDQPPPVEGAETCQTRPAGPERDGAGDPGEQVRALLDALYERLTRRPNPGGLRVLTQQWNATMKRRYCGRCGTLIKALQALRMTLNTPACASSRTTFTQVVENLESSTPEGALVIPVHGPEPCTTGDATPLTSTAHAPIVEGVSAVATASSDPEVFSNLEEIVL
jgi:hypothetical protein